MGSVGSLMSGHSFQSKHCRSTATCRKGVRGRKSGRGLDSLLKHDLTHDSNSNNAKVSFCSGKSEDFFYIKVNHNQSEGFQRSTADEEAEEVDQRRAMPPELVPLSGKLDKSAEKALIRPTAFKPVVPRSSSSSVETHNNLNAVLGVWIHPLHRPRESQETKQETVSGTLSDSGRNSMSSLPTHSGSSHTDNLSTYTGQPLHYGDSGPDSTLQGAVIGAEARGCGTAAASWVSSGAGENNWTANCAADRGSGRTTTPSTRSVGVLSDYVTGSNPTPTFPLTPTSPNHELGPVSLNREIPVALFSEPSPTDSSEGGGVRSPISMDESLIQQLERKLLERESELAELHTCFEEKELDTCQLFEETQRYCAEEMEGLKQWCSTKLRQSSQQACQTQQVLQLQVLQLQQENHRLQQDVEKLIQDREAAENQLRSYWNQQNQLDPTLEEVQWEVCQKAGEISLLKQQLKESQSEVASKLREIVSLKAALREAESSLEELQRKSIEYEEALCSKSTEVEVCQNELKGKKNEADVLQEKVSKLQMDIRGMKQDMQTLNMRTRQEEQPFSETQTDTSRIPRTQTVDPDVSGQWRSGKINTAALLKEVERLREQLKEEKEKKDKMMSSFQEEKRTWNDEKDRVVRYQAQLQHSYLQMCRKNQDLEKILKDLTTEMESRTGQDMIAHSPDPYHSNIIATEI